jgi:hypothetical protein
LRLSGENSFLLSLLCFKNKYNQINHYNNKFFVVNVVESSRKLHSALRIATADRDFLCQADSDRERDAWVDAIDAQLRAFADSNRVSIQLGSPRKQAPRRNNNNNSGGAVNADDYRTTVDRLTVERLQTELLRISQQLEDSSTPVESQVSEHLFVGFSKIDILYFDVVC